MSGLARFFLERGCVVSGSDAAASAVTRALEDAGVRVVIGHDARHVVGADVVIASPAVGIDNVERVAAVALGIPFVDRAHVLAQLASEMNCVGLTGTHGKTTATSMTVSYTHLILAGLLAALGLGMFYGDFLKISGVA